MRQNRIRHPDRIVWQGNALPVWLLLPVLPLGIAARAWAAGSVPLAVLFFLLAALGPFWFWLYSGRKLTIASDCLVLHGSPGERQIPWANIRHVSLRMVPRVGRRGVVTIEVGLFQGGVAVHGMRFVHSDGFQDLADDLYTPLHTRGIPFVVESPDDVAARIRMRSGMPAPGTPPPLGPIPRLPDD